MLRMIHNLLCTVSRRYRVAHCQHVDELPPRLSRRLYKECTEMDPRSFATAEEMFDTLLKEYEEEDRATSKSVGRFGKAAVFA